MSNNTCGRRCHDWHFTSDQGQGACQAVEDTEALRTVLKGTRVDEIGLHLKVFDRLRLEQVNIVSEQSRENNSKEGRVRPQRCIDVRPN